MKKIRIYEGLNCKIKESEYLKGFYIVEFDVVEAFRLVEQLHDALLFDALSSNEFKTTRRLAIQLRALLTQWIHDKRNRTRGARPTMININLLDIISTDIIELVIL